VPSAGSGRAEHFAGGVLVPGLVNTHTHLELTGLEGQATEPDFPAWIRSIIALKAGRRPEDFLAAARRGLADCFAAGVTTVADTGDSGAPFDVLLEQRASGIAYLEVFGPDPALAESQFREFRDRVLALRPRADDRVRLGVSPHAPYSVSGPLYRLVADFAREQQLPIAVHVAESAAESELLEAAAGPFAGQWTRRGIPLPGLPGRSPLAWLDEHGVLGPSTLCIHVVRPASGDVERLARHDAPIAHCPRSNRRHGHGDAPLRRLLDAGLRVGAGTDSVASVHPMDLLAEARMAAGLAGLGPGPALDLVMLGAARALGLESGIGSLAPGKWGDCAVIELPRGTGREAVAGAILHTGPGDVAATFLAGREVYRR
jgi:5-methylthioadenosine/S-adenosylhomocysteine deaminase